MFKLIASIICVLIVTASPVDSKTNMNIGRFILPVMTKDRSKIESISLTGIGRFGEYRKARISFPAHLHTGIDIKRPSGNYENEPVFSIYPGKVLSVRDDGPYAQIIIEHLLSKNRKIWSVYEHVAGIMVKVSDHVESNKPIARFMNKKELNKFGWQFDHFHFEILKIAPKKVIYNPLLPGRFYATYNMECFTPEILNRYYYDPIVILRNGNAN
jgi:murein DD-endopeptidase MepM/ murein hydrolase activator NlpD